jgi:hypothetical protein
MKDKIKESNKTDRKELQRSSHGRERRNIRQPEKQSETMAIVPRFESSPQHIVRLMIVNFRSLHNQHFHLSPVYGPKTI